MTQEAPVELLIGTIRSPKSGADKELFINETALVIHENLYASFGGGLLGQSVTAAAATVPPTFAVYSMQSAFLRPVRGDKTIAYHVDCTANGRTYATRVVRATQGSDGDDDNASCIYVGILSFQRSDLPPSNVLNYSTSMPCLGDSVQPESIPKARVQQQTTTGSGDVTSPPSDGDDKDATFDWRPLESTVPSTDGPARSLQQRAFVRSAVPLSSSSDSASSSVHRHLAALACLSDTYMLGTALGHGANPATLAQKIQEEVAMGVSLNHNISLHDPTARVDEWLLCERDTSWGADGRVLVHQRFWSVGNGRLVMSGTQEGLIRLKPGSSL